MNIYQTRFWAKCPVNKQTIYYDLQIRHNQQIKVESILDELTTITEGFHEDIADQLHDKFGGNQIIKAEHHGVHIITERP